MKKITLTVLVSLVLVTGMCQPTPQATFSITASRSSDTTASVLVRANIPKGYALFSANKKDSTALYYSALELLIPDNAVQNNRRPSELGDTTSFTDPITHQRYPIYTDSARLTFSFRVDQNDSILKGNFNYLLLHNNAFISDAEPFRITIAKANSATPPRKQYKSLFSIFMFCFASGVLAMITPCVFPLVPVTVSYFLKKAGNRFGGISSALWYSTSIIVIYTIPTLILTSLFGDAILYRISTSAISNLFFFFIFLLFAISFFGGFDLALPNKWANKADASAGKGGWVGTFFMALTLVIVSFSCTGPIVGTLLGQTSKEGISIAPIIGMMGFSIGLALPFTLFALFPSLLSAMPKSGGWLNSVKITFGFIELALGLKFLSNVDLIYGWHLLDREIFLSIWIALAILLSLYLLGKIHFSHDSPVKYLSIPRLLLAITVFSFTIYLVPGLWGAPLKAMSGLLPPTNTQDFNLDQLQYTIGSNTTEPAKAVKLAGKLHLPNGLSGYFDLDEGIAAARALHKPLMLDFTGHSCANCRKMEQSVWRDPEVLKRLKEDFVIVSLYVDEPTELPQTEQYTTKDGRHITTVGEKNLDYEVTHFGFNAQPLYMFLAPDGTSLSETKYGYDPDIKKFIAHLSSVKNTFKPW